MLVLTHDDGSESVLRVIDREPWATHRADLVRREHDVQALLADTPVPAPRPLAVDPGSGRHLMTLLPGGTDNRADDSSLNALGVALATIHDVRPVTPPRTFQSWAWEAKYVVPAWADHPDAWETAFDLLRGDLPGHEPTFIHRDYQPRNVLWTGDDLAGVVDWVETSTGPAWLDVAHCATNIAVRHGVERATAFTRSYAATTGRAREPFWEVMDVVGFLPPPGRREWFTAPSERRGLEEMLLSALRP